MSAAVIPFTGKWQGRTQPTKYEGRQQCRAMHDARLIRAARASNDDWTARVLWALLETLSSEQIKRLEFALCGEVIDSQSAVQALAIAQFFADFKHRQRVNVALAWFAARETE